MNTTQEDISISIRTNKSSRSQIMSTTESKLGPPPKSSTIRKNRGKFFFGHRNQKKDKAYNYEYDQIGKYIVVKESFLRYSVQSILFFFFFFLNASHESQ